MRPIIPNLKFFSQLTLKFRLSAETVEILLYSNWAIFESHCNMIYSDVLWSRSLHSTTGLRRRKKAVKALSFYHHLRSFNFVCNFVMSLFLSPEKNIDSCFWILHVFTNTLKFYILFLDVVAFVALIVCVLDIFLVIKDNDW